MKLVNMFVRTQTKALNRLKRLLPIGQLFQPNFLYYLTKNPEK